MPFHILFLSFFISISIPNIILITLYHKTPIIIFIGLFTILALSTILVILYDVLVIPIKQIRDTIYSTLDTKLILFNDKKYNEIHELQHATAELTKHYKKYCTVLDTYTKLPEKKDTKIYTFIESTQNKENEIQPLLDYSQHNTKTMQTFHQQLYTTLLQILNGVAKAKIYLDKQNATLNKPNNVKPLISTLNALTQNIHSTLKSTEHINVSSTKNTKAIIETIKAVDNIKTNIFDVKKSVQLLFKKIEKFIDLTSSVNTITEQTNKAIIKSIIETPHLETTKKMFSMLTKKVQITIEKIDSDVKNLMSNINTIQMQSDTMFLFLEKTNQNISNASISITNAVCSVNNLIKNCNLVKTHIQHLQNMAVSQTKKSSSIQQQFNTLATHNAKTNLTIEHLMKQVLLAIKLMEKVELTPSENKNMPATQKPHYNQQKPITTNIPVIDYLYEGLDVSLNIFYNNLLMHKEIHPDLQQMLTNIRCSILNIVQIESFIYPDKKTSSEYIQQVKKILHKIEYALHFRKKETCHSFLENLKQKISNHIEYVSKQYISTNKDTIKTIKDLLYT